MAEQRNYKAQALVLKWVKLRESDAIVKMVDEQGCLLEAVARGARKPHSALSSRLEQFNKVEVFLAKGKGLDIVREARVDVAMNSLRGDPLRFSCASCLTELLSKSLQPNIDVPKVFGLACRTMEVLSACREASCLPVAAASLIKAASYLGFMPSFAQCVSCGVDIEGARTLGLSYSEGGVVCESCILGIDAIEVDSGFLSWANALLRLPLSDVAESDADVCVGRDMLLMASRWIKVQTGISLKSPPLAIELASC